MAHRSVETSPQTYARIGGLLYLIFRSTFLPRFLGVLMAIAGLCYLTDSFTLFLVPRLASALFPYILAPCLVGEAALCLWLLVMGVNVPKYLEKVTLGERSS